MIVKLEISGLLIDFDTRFPDYVRKRCEKYVVETQKSGILLRARDEDIARANAEVVGEMEAELYAMTIPLGECMPEHGRLMTHGVAISCDGKSFIFTAESGVGKSTHAFLWQKYLGEDRVRIINGDKPILWLREDGEILACGSPWSGKEHLDENSCVPLRGICLLERLGDGKGEGCGNGGGGEGCEVGCSGERPSIVRATQEETLDFLMHQIFLPSHADGRLKTLQLLEKLYAKVPVYSLKTDMSREGVNTSSECLLHGVE